MAKRTDATAPSATVRVLVARPGILACGPYQAGQVYEVSAEEARRLLRDKGFTVAPAEAPQPTEE